MNALIFAGQSLSNREWMERLSQKMNEQGGEFEALRHEYLAWASEPDNDDLKQISAEIADVKDKYCNRSFDVAIGKSFGCLMVFESEAKSRQVVLVGPPVLTLKELGFNLMETINSSDAKILIMMNANDPLVDKDSLEAYAHENPQKLSIHLLTGSKHKYKDIDEYASVINGFLS